VRILVTGGSGFVGRHVVRRLAADGHTVITAQRHAPDAPSPGVRSVALDLATLTPGQLRDAADGPLDVIVHLAAQLDNPFGIDYTLAELAPANVVGTLRLLEAAADLGIGRFVQGSTGGVAAYGPADGAAHEDGPVGPVNPYELTKHLAEQAVRAYAWPFEHVSLRYYAPYGADGSNPLFRHVLDAVREGRPVRVAAGGGPRLNPIHIEDAVAATVASIDAPDLPDVVNVAGPDVVTLGELVGLLADAVGRHAVLEEGRDAGASWVADIERMRRFLVEPQITVAEGVARSWGSVEQRSVRWA
jgi:nucleoside-diphosphate-sugar epimerase